MKCPDNHPGKLRHPSKLVGGSPPWNMASRQRIVSLTKTRLLTGMLLGILVGGCIQGDQPDATRTPTVNVTQAYQTVAARLTLAIALTPTGTSTPVPTEEGQTTPTPPPSLTPSPTLPQTIPSPTPPCDQATGGSPLDLTIPDGTTVKPGEPFTKQWRLTNTGSCSWTADYTAVWFSGDMLGGPSSVPLLISVDPGESVDITVDMVAPGVSGSYQSNWLLRNEAGLLFGIGPKGDTPFRVRIEVLPAPRKTAEPSPEPAFAPSPTPAS